MLNAFLYQRCQTRAALWGLAVLAALLCAPALRAQTSDLRLGCVREPDPEMRVAYCTQLIDSGDLLATELSGAFNSRGVAYRLQGNYDRSIQDHDWAILLRPNYTDAFHNRGMAYDNQGDEDRAIRDFDRAIELDPNYATAFNSRGNAYRHKGDVEHAISDFDQALALNPLDPIVLVNRGLARFAKGEMPQAISDFQRAVSFDENRAYSALWLYLAMSRNGQDGRDVLIKTTLTLDPQVWPGPILGLFLGVATPQEAAKSAAHPNARISAEQLCEAHFYSGEYQLIHRADVREVLKELQAAADTCPRDFIEYQAAKSELGRLSSVPPPAP